MFETDADRLQMLSTLGEVLIYTANGDTHVSSKSKSIYAIFDRPYVETAKVEGYAPVITVRDSDVAGVVHGAMIRRSVSGADIDYKVIGIEPDGTGMTAIMLQEQ